MCRQFLEENPLEEDEKVAVVTHSKLIAALTAKGFTGTGADARIYGYAWTENAEVLGIETESL